MRGQPQLGLRDFIATTTSMRSLLGPFGPGRSPRWVENNMQYFRFLSTLWKCSRVEGLQNDGVTENACPAHEQRAKTGGDPIGGAQLWSTLAAAIKDQQLMPGQHGFGNNGTDSARPC